jgi:L-alanine-DL-glutamate epimerase-like enolase superfamily enzyme
MEQRRWIPGNHFTLLENGEEFFPRVFACIANAKREVIVETFILFEDKVGLQLQEALIAAARRGAQVDITIDDWGSPDLSGHFLGALRAAGVSDAELARVIAEVRAAVGSGIELSMDANRAYPAAGVESYVRAIADAGVRVVEDPCELAPDSAFERLQRASAVPLLVDFAITSRQDAALFLDRGARALMIKPGRIGISEAREIDGLCAARGAGVSLGMWYESALGAALTLRSAALLKSPVILPAECFFPMLAEQVTSPVKIENGAVRLPEEPNLPDWDAVKRFEIRVRAQFK